MTDTHPRPPIDDDAPPLWVQEAYAVISRQCAGDPGKRSIALAHLAERYELWQREQIAARYTVQAKR